VPFFSSQRKPKSIIHPHYSSKKYSYQFLSPGQLKGTLMHNILLNWIGDQPPFNTVKFELSIEKIDSHKLDNTHVQTRNPQAKPTAQRLKNRKHKLISAECDTMIQQKNIPPRQIPWMY